MTWWKVASTNKRKKEGKRMPLCTLVQLLLQGLLIENQIFIELFSTEYRTSIAFHKRKMKLFFEDKFQTKIQFEDTTFKIVLLVRSEVLN